MIPFEWWLITIIFTLSTLIWLGSIYYAATKYGKEEKEKK